MVFSSGVFLFLFLPVVLLIYYNPFIRSQTFRNVVLLLASLGFYAWGEPIFVFLMLFSILLTYLFGLWIAYAKTRKGQKRILCLGISYHVIVLVIFKYLSFLVEQISPFFWGGGGGGGRKVQHCFTNWNFLFYISNDIVFV